MRFDKIMTLEDIQRVYPGRWSGETTDALKADIIACAGDSKVVEVSIDVGAYLCSSVGYLDYSKVWDVAEMIQEDKDPLLNYRKLYIGTLVGTEIDVFTMDEYNALPERKLDGGFKDLAISIEMVSVKAQDFNLRAEWNISPESNEEGRRYYGYSGRAGHGFTHEMKGFTKILDSFPGTTFQKKVWHYLRTIPRGEVRTYKEVAEAIGHPNAYRAVASACAKNPDAPNTPCHRVVASNGTGGYSGKNGIPGKISLLKQEGVDVSKYL